MVDVKSSEAKVASRPKFWPRPRPRFGLGLCLGLEVLASFNITGPHPEKIDCYLIAIFGKTIRVSDVVTSRPYRVLH